MSTTQLGGMKQLPMNGTTKVNTNRFITQSCAQKDEPDFRHPEYLKFEHMFTMTEAFEDGVDGVRDQLIQYPNEEDDTFAKRQKVLTLKNYVKRMAKGTQGMIMRKPSSVLGETNKMRKLLDHVDGFRPLDDILADLINLATRDGKVFLLVDSPPKGVEGDPYISIVLRSQVINWRHDEEGNLTMAVIREVVAESAGTFATQYVEQFRHFDEYADVNIWRMASQATCATSGQQSTVVSSDSSEREWIIHDDYTTDYDFIPLVEIDVSDVPTLFEVAKINLRHMNRQSSLDRYLDIAALPIPLAWGVPLGEDGETQDPKKPAMVLGVDQAIFFTGPKDQADFEWRELSGKSVDLLAKDLRQLEMDMLDVMERAMDEQQKRSSNESATTSKLNNQSRSALLTAISATIEHKVIQALGYLANMIGETFEGSLTINRDFAPLLDASSAPALLQAYVAGAISWETYIMGMQGTEIIQVEDIEEERERLIDEADAAEEREARAVALGIAPKATPSPDDRSAGASSAEDPPSAPKGGTDQAQGITVDQVPTLAGVPKNLRRVPPPSKKKKKKA